ncbi:MAG: hypothetical protein DBX47_03590 [Clostridiales bacterium]|nr:MAG: hypothetical protein DBX47_03590 [Clostridiales bacterium]
MKTKTKKIIRACTIIGVIIIPLMYSYFYLGAFWDPYSKLEDLPVAVVNLDSGAQINDSTRNLGEELCDQLKENGSLKFIFTDEDDAKNGVESTKYYASLVVPENFSECIASASTTDKQIAQIDYKANEKRNYLAAQILSKAVLQIESTLKSKVNSEIIAELCNKLQSTPDKISEFTKGLSQLSEGTIQLKDGAGSLSDGTSKLDNGLNSLNNNMSDYSKGVNTAGTGVTSLLAGADKLQKGINTLADGATKLDDSTSNIDELRQNANLLAQKANEFNNGITAYTNGVSTLIDSVETTTMFLSSYVSTHPELMQDEAFRTFITNASDPKNAQNISSLKTYTTQIKTASVQLSAGIKMLSDATADIPVLKAGITQLKDGLLEAQSGVAQVFEGTSSLESGLKNLNSATAKIKSATSQLANGAEKVDEGANQLSGGLENLNNGIDTAQNKVGDTVTDTKQQLNALTGLSDYSKEPVKINEGAINPVSNYGTAFAPYFLCLSLWVGAIIIFFGIYLDGDNKFDLLSKNSDRQVLRCFSYLIIGIIQAAVLGVVLKFGLGLEIKHMALYCFAICLSSMVYIAIVQFFIVFFKDIGKFLAIALLILQLTSCGGTFPMETVPKFFNLLYPFMPMTYSVGLLKEAISGTEPTYALSNSLVLIAILIVFTVLTLICGKIKIKKEASLSKAS